MAAQGPDGKPDDHPNEVWDIPAANQIAAPMGLDVGWHHPVTADVKGLPILASIPGARPTRPIFSIPSDSSPTSRAGTTRGNYHAAR